MEDETALQFHDQLLYPRDPAQTIGEWYVKWVHTYEKDLSAIDYNGPQLAVDHFLQFKLSKSSRILDIAAGTGIVGSLLKDKGYTNIDGLDGSPEMLAIAKERNIYKNIITSFVSKDIKIPIEDKTYDHIIMSGCFCPGHISYDSFPEIIRMAKPGAIICWSMDFPEKYKERDPMYAEGKFHKYIEDLCAQNKWELIEGNPKRVNNYSRGNSGWVYAMKVL